jgi:hypothetical protein
LNLEQFRRGVDGSTLPTPFEALVVRGLSDALEISDSVIRTCRADRRLLGPTRVRLLRATRGESLEGTTKVEAKVVLLRPADNVQRNRYEGGQ